MNSYFQKPRLVGQIFYQALRALWQSFKSIWLLVLLLYVTQLLVLHVLQTKAPNFLIHGVLALLVLIQFFLGLTCLIKIQGDFSSKPVSLDHALLSTVRKLLAAFIVFCVLLAGVALLYSVGYFLASHTVPELYGPGKQAVIAMASMTGFPIMAWLIFMCMALPLVVTREYSVLAALKLAPRLVKNRWLTLLPLLFLCVMTGLLTEPNTLVGFMLLTHYKLVLSNGLIYLFAYPYCINVTLLLLNDLLVRHGSTSCQP